MGEIYQNLSEIRKKFHRYPERGWREFWTAAEICCHMEKFGFQLQYGRTLFQHDARINVPDAIELDRWFQKALDRGADPKYLEPMKGGFCGVVGILDTGRTGPTFAYESELDALPGVTEFELSGLRSIMLESQKPAHRPFVEGWISENEGIVHACGHDVHMTMALGLAEYISLHRAEFSGKFVFFFTPAEEGGHGAKNFAALPIVDEIDYYFAYHDAVKPVGGLMLVNQVYLRSIVQFLVTITSSPPSSPDLAIFQKLGMEFQMGNIKSQGEFITRYVKELQATPKTYDLPIRATLQTITAFDNIPPRTDGFHEINIYELTQDYEKVRFKVNIRADNNDLTHYYVQHTKSLIAKIADLHQLGYTIEDIPLWSYPAWAGNDPMLAQLAKTIWHEMGLGDTVIDIPFGEMGTDDDVYLMNKIQSHGGKCLYAILVSDSKQGQIGELHTPSMDIDDRLLKVGVDLTINLIKTLLKK